MIREVDTSAYRVIAKSMNEALAMLRKAHDEHEKAVEEVKAKAQALRTAEIAVRQQMDRIGKDKDGDRADGAGLSVFIRQRWCPKWDPEKWPEIVKGFVDLGRTDIIQKGVSIAPLMGLVDDGIPLPGGLSVEAFKRLEVRRSTTKGNV